jgi:copper transport protein
VIVRKTLAALILVGAAACVGVATASAHAVLLRVTPSSSQTLAEAPDQVQLLFSEPLDPAFSSVQVQDTSGQTVDAGDSHVDPNNDQLLVVSLRPGLPNGVYAVQWRSLSAIDVHPDEGQYWLFVGVPVSANPALQAVTAQYTTSPEATFGRWWFYLAASLFGGVLASWKLVLGPVLAEADAARAILRARAFRLIVAGGALLLIGTLYSAVAQAAAAANVPLTDAFGKPLADLLLRGRFAAIWWPRVGLELSSLLLIALGGIDGLASECALATLPAVLLTTALTSHGAALPQGAAPGIAIDWLHILGATAWVGGLVGLALTLPRLRGLAGLVPQLIRRFGRYALVASMVVLLSGVLQGALEVGSWAALVGSLYGQLVLIKIGLLAAMLVFAGLNEWRARAASAVAVARGVRLELALGVLVLAVAAMLSGTPPSPLGI